MLAPQARGPESGPQDPGKKPDTVACTCDHSTGEADTGRRLRFAGQPVQPKETR